MNEFMTVVPRKLLYLLMLQIVKSLEIASCQDQANTEFELKGVNSVWYKKTVMPCQPQSRGSQSRKCTGNKSTRRKQITFGVR